MALSADEKNPWILNVVNIFAAVHPILIIWV